MQPSSVMGTQLREVYTSMTTAPPSSQVSNSIESRGIFKSFSGVPVLEGVDISFRPGEVHTLLGENGAGKSTLFKILSGIYTADAGTVLLNGTEVTIRNPRTAHQHGIYLVPQEPALMQHLTVAENIFLGITPTRGNRFKRVDWKAMRSAAQGIMDRLGYAIDLEQPAGNLSIAQQQLVECARAIAHNCQVVFFDEPTSPLTSHEVEALFKVIRSMTSAGYALGFISHRMEEVLEISHRITVLRDGHQVFSVEKDQANQSELVEHMIGRKLTGTLRRTNSYTTSETALKVQGLAGINFRDINFEVQQGEILGLAGLVGSGRTEIAEAIFNVSHKAGGQVYLGHRDITHLSTNEIIKSGLIYLPEDRAHHGAFARMTVSNNISAGDLDYIKGPKRVWLDLKKERSLADDTVAQLNVKTASIDSLLKSLSGGNQQKIIFGKWLATQPRVAILDEPTRGVDAGAKHEIYALIEKLASEGLAVVVISSELEEIIRLSDRVLTVYEGHFIGELAGDEISMDNIGKMILNHA